MEDTLWYKLFHISILGVLSSWACCSTREHSQLPGSAGETDVVKINVMPMPQSCLNEAMYIRQLPNNPLLECKWLIFKVKLPFRLKNMN